MKKQHTDEQTAARTYRFAFGTDENLYTFSFKGMIPESEIHRMLGAFRHTLYAECGEAARSYLDSRHLTYTDFCSTRTLLEHPAVMTAAERLLHDASLEALHAWAADAAGCYAVIDHQKRMGISCREGCYLAVAGISSDRDTSHEYRVIGQTFRYGEAEDRQHSYFAIRLGRAGSCLHTLHAEERYPVLAVFGCVDVMALLLNIGSITTPEQAAGLADR